MSSNLKFVENVINKEENEVAIIKKEALDDFILSDVLSNINPNPNGTCPVGVKTEIESLDDNNSSIYHLTSIIEVGAVKCDTDQHENTQTLEINTFDKSLETNKILQKTLKPWKPAICSICNSGFPNVDLYEEHLRVAHRDKLPFACSHCKKSFSRRYLLKMHEQVHDPDRFKGEPKYACDLCDNRYHLKASLKNHRRCKHFGHKKKPNKRNVPAKHNCSRKGIQKKRDPPIQKSYFCSQCNVPFKHKYDFGHHMNRHNNKKLTCSICQAVFYITGQLKAHIKKYHNSSSTIERKPYRPYSQRKTAYYPCNICGKIYPIPSALKYHMNIHSNERKYECETCGRKFILKNDCTTHQLIHKAKESNTTKQYLEYKCRICGKTFDKKNSYMDHRRATHKHIPRQGEMEKSFACAICGKPYYQRIQAAICTLEGHNPETLYEKMFKYKCSECPLGTFGYHHLSFLRKHWRQEHSEKILPTKFRMGMITGNNKDDTLPKFSFNRNNCIKTRNSLLDSQQTNAVKYEFPLYIDLELLPFPKEQEANLRKIISQQIRIKKPENLKCTLCMNDHLYSSKRTLRQHFKRVHKLTLSQAAKLIISNAMKNKTVKVTDVNAVKAILGYKTLNIVLMRYKK